MAQPQFLSIEGFNQLLQQWNGKTIKVTKQEIGDYDETVLRLNAVSYDTDTRRIDDYQAKHKLQLNGDGTMLTDAANAQPLPDQVYEIPIEDSTLYQYEDSRFSLTTDRGTYTIELAAE
ncbi:hypothetical protein ERJ70_05235 [Sediminibacillus dalangtanensis]|uniref:Uncharacterized protein n=1 Tax=Sediminibacillus dalangtanensis TaxID=2729421 RepID=A0ABX7VPD3_9BACI|nr:hypothetical protein [Sediminibacillus dalangtanensis]QTM98749.1 hypothetical protein ERJ70_05235 [Sediminibacillus dalangtanensis]